MATEQMLETFFATFLSALRSADRQRANQAIREALAAGLSREQLLESAVVRSLEALGNGWEDGSVSLTQVYMGGRIAEEVAGELLPVPARRANPWGRIVIGTLGDRHGMGQRIVGAYLGVAGAEVNSLGLGVAPEDFVARAARGGCDLIAVSTLMYHSALLVRQVRELLDRQHLRVPILVGGAPFNMDRMLWRQVGADAMGGNPAEGISAARRLILGAP